MPPLRVINLDAPLGGNPLGGIDDWVDDHGGFLTQKYLRELRALDLQVYEKVVDLVCALANEIEQAKVHPLDGQQVVAIADHLLATAIDAEHYRRRDLARALVILAKTLGCPSVLTSTTRAQTKPGQEDVLRILAGLPKPVG
jgi:methyl coenzyme M reductase subunit C-like uncharacterized protein (methanogenesis marker protein 7)